MRYCWFVLIFLVLGCASPSKDKKVVVLENFRGLDALNDSVVWLSGTNGTYMYTIDGGEVWMKGKVEIAKNMDFRDVEVVNDSTAYILSAGFPGLLFKIGRAHV